MAFLGFSDTSVISSSFYFPRLYNFMQYIMILFYIEMANRLFSQRNISAPFLDQSNYGEVESCADCRLVKLKRQTVFSSS